MNMRKSLLCSLMLTNALAQCPGLAQGLKHTQTSASLIQGSVAESAEIRPVAGVLPELAPFGVQCSPSSSKSARARVSSVAPYSAAYWKGLKSGDDILSIGAKQQGFMVVIQRGGQRYAAELLPGATEATVVRQSSNTQDSALPQGDGMNHPFSSRDVAALGGDGIQQGRFPNCWFESSLSAVASTPSGQAQIAQMITSTYPGEYAVTLPGIPGTIRVTQSSMESMRLTNPAPWANILECAERTAKPNNNDSQRANEGYPAIQLGLEILTNKRVKAIRPSEMSTGELGSLLTRLAANQTPATIATKSPQEHGQRFQPIMANHGFSFVGFDGQNVTLRNPLGARAGSTYVHIDLPTFQTFIRYLAYPS